MSAASREGPRFDAAELRRLRVWLAGSAAVLSCLGLWVRADGHQLELIAAYGVGMLGLLVASRRAPELRSWVLADGLFGAVVVAATGGADSPALLALVGPLLLLGMLRAAPQGATLMVLAVVALAVGPDDAPFLAVTGVLVGVTLAASAADRVLRPSDRRIPVVAAEREGRRIEQLGRLLSDVEEVLARGEVVTTPAELLNLVRSWVALIHDPSTVARRPAQTDRPWRILGDDGEVRDLEHSRLPTILRDGVPLEGTVLRPRMDPGDGLMPDSRRAAYLWLPGEGRDVIAIEWDQPAPFGADEADFLERLRTMIAFHRQAQRRLAALLDARAAAAAAREARDAREELAQELTALAFDLGAAARRHREDDQLAALHDRVRARVRAQRAPGVVDVAERTS